MFRSVNLSRCRAKTTNWSVVLEIFSALNQQDVLKAFIWAECKKKKKIEANSKVNKWECLGKHEIKLKTSHVSHSSLPSSPCQAEVRENWEAGWERGKYHSTAFLTKRHCRSMTYQQYIGWKSSRGSVILNYTEATFLRYQERMTFHLFCVSPTWIWCVRRCIHLWRKYWTNIVIIIVIITINNTTFVLLYYKHVSIF